MSIQWDGIGKVLLVGLIAGVGLVAVFTVGVRLLAQAAMAKELSPAGGPTSTAAGRGGNIRMLQALAYVCFAICVGAAGYGIALLLQK